MNCRVIFFLFPLLLSSLAFSQNDTVRLFLINDIVLSGNRATKNHIVYREIPIAKGERLSMSEIRQRMVQAKENLLNTSLFNLVDVDTVHAGNDCVNILVKMTERWYTWPVPVFEVQERNFNEWWKTRNFERANYGMYVERENFRGRKESLSFYGQFGYTEKYGISYKVPYLTRGKRLGGGMGATYSRNHEITYKSIGNKQVFFKDEENYIRQQFSLKLNSSYRGNIYNSHQFEVKYNDIWVHDTVLSLSNDYLQDNRGEMKYFSFEYVFKSDHRNAKYYPLEGYYFDLEFSRLGLGVLSGEDLDVTNLKLSFKEYLKAAYRLYLSGSVKFKYSVSSAQPYHVQQGLGWGDYVRGYEYYVIDGQRYSLGKLGLRYQLVRPRIQSFPLPLNKFNTVHYALYAGLYGDAGYVEDKLYLGMNSMANSWLLGYGAGIDFVTYYDMVFRFEYSVNRRLEHGLFIHFEAGI